MTPRYRQRAAAAPQPLGIAPFDRWLSLDGEEAALFYREDGGYLLRFVDCADFRIAGDGAEVLAMPFPGTDPEMLADLYFNQILPLILARTGQTVLHASAVVVNGHGIAFVGATGRGKSTLAAAFARAGHAFLTDDGLIAVAGADGYAIQPRRPILRLRSDSQAAVLAASGEGTVDLAKQRVAASGLVPFHDQPVPLSAIYVLGESRAPEHPVVGPLAPAAALAQLMQHCFILDVEDRARVSALFAALADLVERVPCAELDYRRDYAALPDVIAALEQAHPTGVQ
jgi:hypothetical protein